MPYAERQIDVRARKIHVAAAAPGVVHEHSLVSNGETHLLRERGGHDDQGQTISGSRREGLRCISSHLRVVFELELALVIKRIDKFPSRILGQRLTGGFRSQVVLHIIAEGKDAIATDALGRSCKQMI